MSQMGHFNQPLVYNSHLKCILYTVYYFYYRAIDIYLDINFVKPAVHSGFQVR